MLETELDESLADLDLEAVYSAPVVVPDQPKRKRRRYRKYPKPVFTEAQWQAILEYQQRRCAVCGEETELYQDHSYRSGKPRGGLCRQCNCASGMLKDSPTRIRRLLAYLANPPAKALGFGQTEVERPTRGARANKQPTRKGRETACQ
jgi:Recombination endonuclease VII